MLNQDDFATTTPATGPAPTDIPAPLPDAVPDPAAETAALGDRIASLCAHISAATYTLLTLLLAFDEKGGWATFNSCAHWLSWRTGISIGPAREKVRVARCLPGLPLISEAFKTGEISYSKVRALTRIADADNEAEILEFARHGTAAHVERMVRHWRRIDRCEESMEERAARRRLEVFPCDDGSYQVRGRLTPEVGALLLKAIEATERKLYEADHEAGTADLTSPRQRRADALGVWLEEKVGPRVQLVLNAFEPETAGRVGGRRENAEERETDSEDGNGHALDGGRGGGSHGGGGCGDSDGCGHSDPGPSRPPALSLVTDDGCRVSAETSERLACDAEAVRIERGEDGSVLDVGRRERFVGWRLRKALEARDGGCRFPGCGFRLRTHAHHIVPWADGGVTAIHNLVLLCPFHHRAVHEGKWRVEMDTAGVPRFFNPLGAPMPDAPEAPAAPEALGAGGWTVETGRELAGWHGQKDIGALTGISLWNGERIDWGWAMACLRPG